MEIVDAEMLDLAMSPARIRCEHFGVFLRAGRLGRAAEAFWMYIYLEEWYDFRFVGLFCGGLADFACMNAYQQKSHKPDIIRTQQIGALKPLQVLL